MKPDTRQLKENKFQSALASLGVYAVIAVILIVGASVNKNFFTLANFSSILNNTPYIGLLCIGFSFVVYAGYMVDMSVPATINVISMVFVACLKFGFLPALIISLISAAAIGFINGYVIGKLKINPIVWTISMNFLVNGTLRFITQNKQVYPDAAGVPQNVVDLFVSMARTRIWGIHIGVYITLVLTIIAYIVFTRTIFGRELKIMGSNMNVAKACGIKVVKNTAIVYVLSAISACLTGIMLASLSKVGTCVIGEGYDFDAVTGCVIGGMSLSGARGNPIGTFGGVITLMILSNVLTFCNLGTYEQNAVKGVVFILIVFINSLSLRKLGRDDV